VLPLVIASSTAYGLSALALKRSVLTEKIARRGLHLTREYSTDPLEAFFASDVMTADPVGVAPEKPASDVPPGRRLYPVCDGGRLSGIVTARALRSARPGATVADVALPDPVAVYADDTLRQVANVFAEHGITAAPVVTRRDPAVLVGVIRLADLLQARLTDLTEEQHREVHLRPVPVRRTRLRGPHDGALRPVLLPGRPVRPRSADRPPARPTP
jgi:hypothetical protein